MIKVCTQNCPTPSKDVVLFPSVSLQFRNSISYKQHLLWSMLVWCLASSISLILFLCSTTRKEWNSRLWVIPSPLCQRELLSSGIQGTFSWSWHRSAQVLLVCKALISGFICFCSLFKERTAFVLVWERGTVPCDESFKQPQASSVFNSWDPKISWKGSPNPATYML